VICHPYFLSRGRHVNEDIPELVAAAAAEYAGVSYVLAEPLGVQSGILGLIDSSVQNSLKLL
jgi:sirohydrochlorin ferrochelatase